jgi:hypothetical protein
MLTKRDAENIGKKLRAEYKPGGNHTRATFRFGGIHILTFGIRHGRTVGHDHLQRELHINLRQCQDLGNCPLSLEKYIEILKDKQLWPH